MTGLALLMGWGGGALAEVTLATSVSKVETILDAGGGVKRELVQTDAVVPGEELRYSIVFTNESEMMVDADRIVITNPIPEGTRFVSGSAGGEAAAVEFSSDGTQFAPDEPSGPDAGGASAADGSRVLSLRWTYNRDLAPGASSEVFFHVRMQ
jgi:uncharacterized repeat protein (TIGR01451 family)